MYKPSCHEEAALIVRPCKSMCFHVFDKCFPVLERLEIRWSDELRCEGLLDDESESCMKDPGYPKDAKRTNDYLKQMSKLLGSFNYWCVRILENKLEIDYSICFWIGQSSPGNADKLEIDTYKAELPKKEAECYRSKDQASSNSTKCSLLCSAQSFYSAGQKDLALKFTMILTSACAFASLTTAIGLLIDSNARTKSTNQILIILAILYFFRSLLTLISSAQLTSSNSDVLFIFLLFDDYLDTATLLIWLVLTLWWLLIVQFKAKSRKPFVCLCLAAVCLPIIKTSNFFLNFR